jgi:hypothetical protein
MRSSAGHLRPAAVSGVRFFARPQKYSSRTGFRALYFSPVEFICCLVVPSSMSYEAESEFQIAARTRGVGGATFHRAPQPRPRIPLVTQHSLAQGLDVSEESRITTRSQILIVTPRLEFPANATKQTPRPISNRYKTHFFHLGTACTSRLAAAPSSLYALPPSLKNPWPPCGGRLIANLELEFSVNPIRITKLEFPNRKFFAISSLLTGATNLGSQATISNLQAARRIRDTSPDNASLRAFLRCYASCGSRRESE